MLLEWLSARKLGFRFLICGQLSFLNVWLSIRSYSGCLQTLDCTENGTYQFNTGLCASNDTNLLNQGLPLEILQHWSELKDFINSFVRGANKNQVRVSLWYVLSCLLKPLPLSDGVQHIARALQQTLCIQKNHFYSLLIFSGICRNVLYHRGSD